MDSPVRANQHAIELLVQYIKRLERRVQALEQRCKIATHEKLTVGLE